MILLCAAVVLTVVRRPDQFLHPAVWVEDGRYFVPEYLEHGWRALFLPVSGYYATSSRLINVVGLSLSGRHYPEIASALNLLVCAASVVAVGLAPTVLRARTLCAILMLVIPTAPEVFGVSLYSLWWTSLLVIAAALWDDPRAHPVLRCLMIVIGGLSSPTVIGLSPIFALRSLLNRSRHDLAALGTALVCSGIQLAAMLRFPEESSDTAFRPLLVLRKYVGEFFVLRGNNHELAALLFGAVFVCVVLVYTHARWRRGGVRWVYLTGVWLVCVVMCSARVPIELVHPIWGGARYFFFPYILIAWLLVQLLTESRHLWSTALVLCAVVIGVRQSQRSFIQRHDTLDWVGSLEACARGEISEIPVHYDGHTQGVWRVPLGADDCRRMLED